MANAQDMQRGTKGLEKTVERTGQFIFGMSILAGLALGVMLIMTVFSEGMHGMWPLAILGSLLYAGIFVFSGFCTWLFFRSVAEHLRVQKYAAGLPYAGDISRPTMTTYTGCSECFAPVNQASNKCTTCGASFVQPSVEGGFG